MNANEAAVRNAYQVAERKDYSGWVNCFTEDGTFTDESIGATYRVDGDTVFEFLVDAACCNGRRRERRITSAVV